MRLKPTIPTRQNPILPGSIGLYWLAPGLRLLARRLLQLVSSLLIRLSGSYCQSGSQVFSIHAACNAEKIFSNLHCTNRASQGSSP